MTPTNDTTKTTNPTDETDLGSVEPEWTEELEMEAELGPLGSFWDEVDAWKDFARDEN